MLVSQSINAAFVAFFTITSSHTPHFDQDKDHREAGQVQGAGQKDGEKDIEHLPLEDLRVTEQIVLSARISEHRSDHADMNSFTGDCSILSLGKYK